MLTTKEKIAVMQAYEDGYSIQYRDIRKCPPCWESMPCWESIVTPGWDWIMYEYRIAPGQPAEETSSDDVNGDSDDESKEPSRIAVHTIAHLQSIKTYEEAETLFDDMRVEDFKYLYSWMKEYASQMSDKFLN